MYGFWFGEIPILHQAGSTHNHCTLDFCREPADGGQATRSERRTGILSLNILPISTTQICISLLRGEALTAPKSVRWRGTAGKAAILRPHLAFPQEQGCVWQRWLGLSVDRGLESSTGLSQPAGARPFFLHFVVSRRLVSFERCAAARARRPPTAARWGPGRGERGRAPPGRGLRGAQRGERSPRGPCGAALPGVTGGHGGG